MPRPTAILFSILLVCGAADARTLASKTRQLDFTYTWPALPPGLPRLEARLNREALVARVAAKRKAVETWAADRGDSAEDPPGHSYEKSWSLRVATPRLLALEAANQVYTGGAHEGIAYDALLWDRKSDQAIRLGALFSAPARALGQMESAYCAQLRQDQMERRGEGWVESDFRCPSLASAPVVLTGTSRVTGFDVLLQPYAAGSWAEGPYEVEVAFPSAVLKLVRPQYKASFQGSRFRH